MMKMEVNKFTFYSNQIIFFYVFFIITIKLATFLSEKKFT